MLICFLVCNKLQLVVSAKESNNLNISGGSFSSFSILDDGTVWAWGNNESGMLGDGTEVDKSIPVKLSLDNIKQIEAGYLHTVALKKDGTVWAWGNNRDGQLGDGTYEENLVPKKIYNLNNIVQISVGQGHTLALTESGQVWAWGDNARGQVGNNSNSSINRPIKVAGLSGIRQISAGASHSIALKSDGTIWTWGSNEYGQLGIGKGTEQMSSPVKVKNISGVRQISAGAEFNVALLENGRIKAWGNGEYGEMGDGSTSARYIPTSYIENLNNVKQVSAGWNHAVALLQDGTVWTWGENTDGALGNGSYSNAIRPVKSNISNVAQVSAGDQYVLALKHDGKVMAWGYNGNGQLGDGTETSRYSPVEVGNVIVVLNVAPSVTINSPKMEEYYSLAGKPLIPSVTVSDENNDTLEVKLFFWNEKEPRETRIVTNTSTPTVINFNEIDLTGYNAYYTKTIKIHVSDGKEITEAKHNFYIDNWAPEFGYISHSSGETSIYVNADIRESGAPLAENYCQFIIEDFSSGWINASKYKFTGLKPDKSYNYIIQVRDEIGNVRETRRGIETQLQSPELHFESIDPRNVIVTVKDENPTDTLYMFSASLRKAGDENKYYYGFGIYENGRLHTNNEEVYFTLPNKQLQITNAWPNSLYSIRASLKNEEENKGAGTNSIQFWTLAESPKLLFDNFSNQIQINWTDAGANVTYMLDIDGEIVELKSTGSETQSYTHQNLQPETTHRYRIACINEAGTGTFSDYITVSTLPEPPNTPQGLTAVSETEQITLNWDATEKTDNYEIEVDGNIISLVEREYIHTGLVGDTEHTYRIRAVNGGGVSQWSEMQIVRTLPYPPDSPVLSMLGKTKNVIELSWNAIENVKGYELKVDGLIIDIQNVITYTHENLDTASNHTYMVRAYNDVGKSLWSEELTTMTNPDAPIEPSNVMATADEESITLTWYQVPYAESYEIEIDGAEIVPSTERLYIHSGLGFDEEHTYKVRAKNISGISDWSTVIKAITMSDPNVNEGDESTKYSLTNVIALVTNESITLSWDDVDSNVEYEIEVDGELQNLGFQTIYNHSQLQAKEFHNYKIRVIKDGKKSNWCAVLSLSTLENPPQVVENLIAQAYTDKIILQWDKAENATAYEVERDGTDVVSTDQTSLSHDELEPGTSHKYRVRAKNITGITAWSPVLVVNTENPNYTINCNENDIFSFSIIALNVQDFNETQFCVSYDASQLELIDFYEGTVEEDEAVVGEVSDSNLEILEMGDGVITFKMNKNMVPGNSWSGELTSIKFRAKSSTESFISLQVKGE